MTQPQPAGGTRIRSGADHYGRGGGIEHVDRQLVVRSALGVQLGQGGNRSRQPGAQRSANPEAPTGRPQRIVVHEYGDAVRGQPDIGFQGSGAASQRGAECRQCVVGARGTSAMGEPHRLSEHSRHSAQGNAALPGLGAPRRLAGSARQRAM